MYNTFKKNYSPEELELFEFLSSIRLFEKLTNEEMAHFSSHLHPRTYSQDEVVFFRGDPSYALYLVKKGKVSLRMDINDEFEELAIVRSGDSFGDNSLLEDTKRIYSSVVVTEKAELFVIPKASILDILDNEPEIRAKMMTAFAKVYNEYTTTLFKKYKSAFGFFDLNMVYEDQR